ncbi:MAG TPA: glycoside hydrolase family 3 N-terminal domain-containing protein, partial [Rectinemataceae bacterium]|nr:glycoside hydrolase family 3 N-terminal domain-containing protein [Rectinemataceae bacterium]
MQPPSTSTPSGEKSTPEVQRGRGALGRAWRALAVLLVAASSLLLGGAAAPSHDFWAAGKDEALASSLLERMGDVEVLGQLLMLAYPGSDPPPLLFDWIEARGLGGVKIFGWNAEDTDRLAVSVAALQRRALSSGEGIPLLLATDQEGGWIRHVKGATTVTPGNMAIGASGRPYDAYRSAFLIGRELAALGINMNFAPAVDLATRPKSQIIGPRAFSSDPMEAAALGAAFARGLAEAGIIATAKHFPGHGDTEQDSHGVLPVIMDDEKTLWNRELIPYRMLAAEGIPAVMSGHLSFPLITGDGSP